MLQRYDVCNNSIKNNISFFFPSPPTRTLQQILAEKQKANQSRNTVAQNVNKPQKTDITRNNLPQTQKAIPASGQSLLKRNDRPPSSKKQNKQAPPPVDIIVLDD